MELQPTPAIFFKSLFEFNGANIVSVLAFDSKSIKFLLDDGNEKYFQMDYPIFYKNQIQKKNNPLNFYYRTAISNALKNNQIRAVESMIKYITKYQNSYVSFFQFKSSINDLLKKKIGVRDLFNSKIFTTTIEFDEWP